MKYIYNIIEKIGLFFLRIIFKILHKELSPEVEKSFVEFIKFGIVGLSNTVISYLLYLITLTILDKNHLCIRYDYFIANMVAFILSVLWSFYWNNKYVFTVNDGEERNIFAALIKTYMSYAFTGLFLTNVLAFLWVDILGVSKLISPLITLIISVPINFVMNKLWAFKSKEVN
ncbi:GtrA family protein [Lachnospira pectinoschiza]|uniref:Putative flippase GtrA (Transmembrane translocase of bactoprenol-linked glucose) n=1 Tax=Lachnospira pectinoschiza TaxID=28052 RepID=A0A1G9SU53_9FIRM|nr:GtrA family protein [Lachnospira pectinoschiza]SDM38395.1 Putative flippase GtrA (transmembrane translocase of bactoprenol-linked glucose) [Lachnospira pectinoschiza]